MTSLPAFLRRVAIGAAICAGIAVAPGYPVSAEEFPAKTAALHPRSPDLRGRVLDWIDDPSIALTLVVIGTLGIYAEFCAPGLVVPGVAGAVFALLGVTGLAMFPTDVRGVALMTLGFALFVLEAGFRTRGALMVCGGAAFACGATLLIDTRHGAPGIGWSAAIGLAVPFALTTTFLLSVAGRARRNKACTGR